MADEQEEIIVIEEADAAGVDTVASSNNDASEPDESSNKKKKLIFIGGALALLLLVGGSSWVLFFSGTDEAITQNLDAPIADKIKKSDETIIEPSALENMIERANYLYTNGNQTEALKLYEKIALYSEAISQYNLGVVQLKEGEYAGALENFKRSIDSSENRCVSAINAAVCSLHLKREKDFNYYIDMAQTYLPKEANSPMYSYYYALINYYKGRYLAEFSFRNDWSSNFAKGYRSGFFPSFSLGWNLKEENFLKNIESVDILKFRGSWGEVGLDNVSPLAYIQKVVVIIKIASQNLLVKSCKGFFCKDRNSIKCA